MYGDVIKFSFVLQFYRSEAWFELNKEQINAARTVQVLPNCFFFSNPDIINYIS